MTKDELYRETACVRIKKGAGRSLKAGGAWIYDNEIDTISGEYKDGDLVTAEDFDGYPLGHGFINTHSKLTVRMLSRKRDAVINDEFIEMRVRNAWEYRKATVDTSSCRVIFGEADFLPGIVIDKFSDVLVVESLALGIDRLKPVILEKLLKVLKEEDIHIRGIYERSDAKVRLQEGMDRYKGFIGEAFDTKVEILENGVRYLVDVEDGQKTGFFLDQKYNRLAVQNLCKKTQPERVLDCFTHTGSFALNAGIAGSGHVLGVDASELAVEQARENARLNGLEDRVHFQCNDKAVFIAAGSGKYVATQTAKDNDTAACNNSAARIHITEYDNTAFRFKYLTGTQTAFVELTVICTGLRRSCHSTGRNRLINGGLKNGILCFIMVDNADNI